MDKKIVLVIFATIIARGHGLQSSNDDFIRNYEIDRNYDISRNRVPNNNGFSLRDIWDLLVGGGYGYPNYGNYPNYPNNYPSGPGLYPSGPGYPGQYPGSNYPQYPHNQVAGPPGAHPGCPLCDSSVYGYCSRKQEHDACCCDGPGFSLFGCRRTDCKFLYANSCQEHKLITNCCCIDLLKNSVDAALPVAPAVIG